MQDSIFSELCYRFVDRVVYMFESQGKSRAEQRYHKNDYSTSSGSPLDFGLSRDLFCRLNDWPPFDCILWLREF